MKVKASHIVQGKMERGPVNNVSSPIGHLGSNLGGPNPSLKG